MGFPGIRPRAVPKLEIDMSLYRRGRIWWLKLPSKSGPVRESTGTSDKRLAQEKHERRKTEIWRQEQLGEKVVTWGQAVKTWLDVQPRGMPDKYRIKALGISPTDTLPLSADLIEAKLKGCAAGTFNRSLALLVAIHNTSKIKPPAVDRKKQPPGRTRWLSEDEWLRLRASLEAESPLLRQAAEFTLAVGLRENNVLELTWDQIDLKRGVAWLHGDQTKQKKPLGVPLNEAALAILAERKGIDKNLVFGNPDYALYKASNRAWYSALRKAKLVGFRWHDLRHTWASWAVMSGVRLEELQRMGGWATAQMVQRYAHLSSEHLAEAAAKIRPISLRYNAPRRASRSTK